MGTRKKFPGEDLSKLRFAEFALTCRAVKPEEIVARGLKVKEDEQGRTLYEVAISSENEIERWFGIEILGHGKDEIDFTRMLRGMAVLVDHDRTRHAGVIEPGSYRVDSDNVLRGWARFSKSTLGREIEQDVVDEIRTTVSVGYYIKDWTVDQRVIGKDEKGRDRTIDVYRITRWQPAEVSPVSVPADVAVGFGRSAEGEPEGSTSGGHPAKEERAMPETTHVKPAGGEAEGSTREAPATATVEVTAEARNKESAEIIRMCARNEMVDKAPEFIARGLNVDQVAHEILKARATAGEAQPAAEAIGNKMSDKERKRYSYVRAIRIAAGLHPRADEGLDDFKREKFDGLEAEVHRELLGGPHPQNWSYRGGIIVPMDRRSDEEKWQAFERQQAMQSRMLDSKTLTKGVETVWERPGEMIELLRNTAILPRLGARVLAGLTGPVAFTKQTGGLSVYWVGENPGADVTESDVAFGLANLIAKTLQATTAYSRQLIVQSSIDVEAMVKEEFAIAHALILDRTGFHGKGANGEPTGIYKTPDVKVRAVGGNPDLADVVDPTIQVAEANALLGALGWVMTPRLAGFLRQTLEFAAAGARPIWDGSVLEGQVAGFRAYASNQISKTMTGSEDTGGTEHGAIFGNWRDLIIGMFANMELVVDPYSKKKRGLIEVTSFQMADLVVRHGESFCKFTGATAP